MAPTKWSRAGLTGTGGPKSRWFIEPRPDGWSQPVIVEWELRGEAWTDLHVHDEYAYVLEGRLFVECDGVTLDATAGDLVRVPANSVGRYCAPEYARMLGVYAPNPDGHPVTQTKFEKLTT